MSLKTREKIVITGKNLFNQNGFGATTLYQIAQELGISRGNLTYYFKNKAALLAEIAAEMASKYTIKMAATQFPSWENTNNATKAFHELQQEYGFIFQDKQVMAFPFVKAQIEQIYKDDLKRQMAMISFSIQVGNMRKEIIPGTYHNLCRTLWMNAFFWLLSDIYQDLEKETGWDKIAWSLVLPHFTEKGLTAFKEHFGEAYYLSLGKTYQQYAEKSISF
ncbi:MAG: TetR family transcriptional regulator [Saprospiraceae bacterium]